MVTVTPAPVPPTPEALAEVLGETAPAPRQLLRRLLTHLGPERCGALLTETLTVEAQGGCLRQDGQRRTPGGTFFFLAKRACTPAERRGIFFPPQPRRPTPRAGPSTWASLAELKQHIPRAARGGGTMTLTFIGVPGKLQHDRTCVLFRVLPTPTPGLPRELPALEPGDAPPWTVVIPLRLWLEQQLPATLRDHSSAQLHCEGVPVMKDGHCFLFATSVRALG